MSFTGIPCVSKPGGLRSASGQVNKQEGHTLPTSNGSTEYKGILSPVECRQLKPKEILECSLWLLGSSGPQNEGGREITHACILIVLRSLFWSHKLRTRPLSMNDHEKNPRNLKNTPQKMPPYNQTFNLMYCCTLFCFTGK